MGCFSSKASDVEIRLPAMPPGVQFLSEMPAQQAHKLPERDSVPSTGRDAGSSTAVRNPCPHASASMPFFPSTFGAVSSAAVDQNDPPSRTDPTSDTGDAGHFSAVDPNDPPSRTDLTSDTGDGEPFAAVDPNGPPSRTDLTSGDGGPSATGPLSCSGAKPSSSGRAKPSSSDMGAKPLAEWISGD